MIGANVTQRRSNRVCQFSGQKVNV